MLFWIYTQDLQKALKEFQSFYSKLYQATSSMDLDHLLSFLQSLKPPKLVTSHKKLMSAPITIKERGNEQSVPMPLDQTVFSNLLAKICSDPSTPPWMVLQHSESKTEVRLWYEYCLDFCNPQAGQRPEKLRIIGHSHWSIMILNCLQRFWPIDLLLLLPHMWIKIK